MLWREITTYEVLYRHKPTGVELTVRTLQPPPNTRVFGTGHGRKKFKAVRIKTNTKECIIVAKAAKQDKPVKDEELEALENIDEELEALAETTGEDEEEAPTEAPKKNKKGKKGKTKDSAPKESRSRTTDGKVGTREIADAAGLEGTSGARTLRMVLRKHAIPKDDETGRYEWASLKDPTVKKILKLIEGGEAEKVKKEGLDRLKQQQEDKRAAKKNGDGGGKKGKGKKGKKNKKAAVVDEDDE